MSLTISKKTCTHILPKKTKNKNERKILKTLVSWNVNGIRACEKKGFTAWIGSTAPDIVCLQEIKAEKDQFPDTIIALDDYHLYINSAQKKGVGGAACRSKQSVEQYSA